MTTDPERAVNTGATESVEDEDDNNQRKILRGTEVLDALRDCITTSTLEVLQYFASCKFNEFIYSWIYINCNCC